MTPNRKVTIRLSDDQRPVLHRYLSAGTHPSRLLVQARILLKADADGPDAWTDEEIAEHLETSRMTVMRVRQQFAAEALTPPSTARSRPGGSTASSTGSRKRNWSRWRARRRRRGRPVGRWRCWPIAWWR